MLGIPRLPSLQRIVPSRHLDHGFDGQPIFLGECEVSLIMRRYAHDGAVAVAHQDVIANPHRQQFVRERMPHRQAARHAFFFLSCKFRLHRRAPLALLDEGGERRIAERGERCEWMFSGNGAKRHPHDGVGAGRECIQHCAAFARIRKSEANTLAAADPVCLHGAHPVGPAGHRFQCVKQILGVRRYLQIVHRDFALLDQRTGAPTAPVDYLFIRKYRSCLRGPNSPGRSSDRQRRARACAGTPIDSNGSIPAGTS